MKHFDVEREAVDLNNHILKYGGEVEMSATIVSMGRAVLENVLSHFPKMDISGANPEGAVGKSFERLNRLIALSELGGGMDAAEMALWLSLNRGGCGDVEKGCWDGDLVNAANCSVCQAIYLILRDAQVDLEIGRFMGAAPPDRADVRRTIGEVARVCKELYRRDVPEVLKANGVWGR